MKSTLKKSISMLLVAVMLVTTFVASPITASAASKTTYSAYYIESKGLSIWADPEGVLTQETVTNYSTDKLALLGGIQPHIREATARTSAITGSISSITSYSSDYYLFLPSTADCSALTFWFDSTASVDGTQLTSGVPTNVFEDLNAGGVSRTVTLTLGADSYNVTVMKSAEVAAVYIDTASGSLQTITESEDHSAYETGSIMVVQPDGSVDYMGAMDKMSGRGNGTWDEEGDKNPYNIKLAVSTSLLGMNKAKKWCLLANEGDSSLVKDQLTYDFAKYIGINYQPVCKPVDLYVNQQYLGSYQLSERVEIKSNRINITDAFENLEIANGTVDGLTGAIIPANLDGTEVTTYNPKTVSTTSTNRADHTVGAKRYSPSLTDPSDCTGGYLYELEISNRWVDENAGFCAYNRQGWVIKSCDYATESMVDYSYNLLYALGAAVYNNGTVPEDVTTTNTTTNTYIKTTENPAPAAEYKNRKWSDILDADSAVRYYWTQEFFKNMDSSTSSTYFYKDCDSIDGKLYAGPMWDMDNSIGYGQSGSRWGSSWTSSTGWYAKNARMYRFYYSDSSTDYSSDNKSPLNFYAALATNCSDFWAMAEKYWYAYIEPAVKILTGNAVDETGTLKSAADYINAVEKSGIMNALRYGSTYDADSHISGMTTWFTERENWINNESGFSKTALSGGIIEAIPDYSYTGKEITPKLNIKYNDSLLGTLELTEGVDYTVSYSNNIDAGTATVTVTGINGYTGTRNTTFKIVPLSIESAYLTIDDAAYKDMQLTAVLTNPDGNEIESSVTYQWYRDGAAIDGATDKTYVTTESDAGTQLTVIATGDGKNLTGSLTSNVCTVLAGERPVGYTKTIASWDYDYTLDSTALVTADPNGTDYYYLATSGENQSSSNLYASVNAVDNAKIKWSGTGENYTNDSNSVASDQSPIMATSKTDGLAWGEYPYFEAVVSTAGFESIKFSAKLGGSKKAPRDWKLQYSLDGISYADIEGASYSITKNKTMELAFNDIALPSECDNQKAVYIRMIAASNTAINGTDVIVGQPNGDAAVNNIKVTGATLSVITELYEPTVTAEGTVFDDSTVVITDNNGGADVFYAVNGGEPVLYTEPFNPFDAKISKVGDTAEITAYAKFNDIVSPVSTLSVTFGGVDINNFSYLTYSTDVTGGAVASTGGVYGLSGRMTAYTDGNSQYVPLWNADNGAFSVAPDDDAKWSESSGFTFKVSTAGYTNVNFSCKAYTTNNGPKSITLQYSTDGINYYDVKTNVDLPANGVLEQAFLTAALPAACDNSAELYIRLVTTEDLTYLGNLLHNNESKGNLYVNNVIVAGEDNGEFKMPYTNKSTDYFGDNGIIEYVSPDGKAMQYVVIDSNQNIVQSGAYPQTGIQLSTVDGFKNGTQEAYTVLVSVVDDEDSSAVSRRTYYYKGETVVKFNYNSTTKLFTDYVSADSLSVSNTSGANSGTLSMYPNGQNPTVLTYTGTYGVKTSWSADNIFAASKKLDNPDGNGFWLIETSTLGYKSLTLNLEQLSSNKGPRDWGIAYSLDGSTYTYVENSNVRAISNDAVADTVETYGNLALPSECSNQEKLYIKVFINGGESVDGTELELVTKGNTGINKIEINGIPTVSTVTVNSTVLETPNAVTGSIAFGGVDVYVNGELKGTTDETGMLSTDLANGTSYEITLKGNNIVERTFTMTVTGDETVNVPVLVFDVNGDGYVNAKDYAVINKNSSYDGIKQFFENFINCKTAEFIYK